MQWESSMKYLKNVPVLLAILVFAIVLTSVLSRYPGSINLEWRLDGGRIEINGNPATLKPET